MDITHHKSQLKENSECPSALHQISSLAKETSWFMSKQELCIMESTDLYEWWDTKKGSANFGSNEGSNKKKAVSEYEDTTYDVYKALLLFVRLFGDRAETLQKYIDDLRSIADGVDKFHKGATIASIAGGAVSAAGGITTIVGLILAPFTFGASIIVTAVGLGVATAGGLSSASATISDTVNTSIDRKKVEAIIEGYQKDIKDVAECMDFVNTGIENINQMKSSPEIQNMFQAGCRASKGFANIAEIVRVVQLAQVAGGAVRAVRIAGVATGILAGLFLGLDVFFIAKDSIDLHKGAKTEFATKVREVADELQEGLLQLSKIRDELEISMELELIPY
ncbi:apolipoprotein L3-like [Erpetoichthys calabaricus]|uniref:apolipoprotein L3-like n=1 Tax=Erpetoichthys calabaricus TaxID=27687 RepID=UPI00109F1F13|nr:apolipoprotein L3-like [Erpetoichthys calabaricus]